MKCNNCGETFEGKSCPNCGASMEGGTVTLNITPQYTEHKKLDSGLTIVKDGNLMGIVDDCGAVIIPLEYDSIRVSLSVGDHLNGGSHELDLYNEFSLIYAHKYSEVYLYSKEGELVYHLIGYIHDHIINSSKLLLKSNKDKYSIFDLNTRCEILANIRYFKDIINKYRCVQVEESLKIYDSRFNFLCSIDEATSISYHKEGHVLIVEHNKNKLCKIYDTSLKHLGTLPKGVIEYDIKHIESFQYFLCAVYSAEHRKSLYGVFDIQANEWHIPMEYDKIVYDEKTNQFNAVGQNIRDSIRQTEEEALEIEEKEKRNKLLATICISLGIIGFIAFFVNVNNDNVFIPILYLFAFGVFFFFGLYKALR